MKNNMKIGLAGLTAAMFLVGLAPSGSASVLSSVEVVDQNCNTSGDTDVCLDAFLWDGVGLYSGATTLVNKPLGTTTGSVLAVGVMLANATACGANGPVFDFECGNDHSNRIHFGGAALCDTDEGGDLVVDLRMRYQTWPTHVAGGSGEMLLDNNLLDVDGSVEYEEFWTSEFAVLNFPSTVTEFNVYLEIYEHTATCDGAGVTHVDAGADTVDSTVDLAAGDLVGVDVQHRYS